MKALLRSEHQYRIIIASIELHLAETAAEALRKGIKSESVLEAAQMDVEDDESISQLFCHISSKYPRLDIL